MKLMVYKSHVQIVRTSHKLLSKVYACDHINDRLKSSPLLEATQWQYGFKIKAFFEISNIDYIYLLFIHQRFFFNEAFWNVETKTNVNFWFFIWRGRFRKVPSGIVSVIFPRMFWKFPPNEFSCILVHFDRYSTWYTVISALKIKFITSIVYFLAYCTQSMVIT